MQIPAVESAEMVFPQSITSNLREDQLKIFIALCNSKRKKGIHPTLLFIGFYITRWYPAFCSRKNRNEYNLLFHSRTNVDIFNHKQLGLMCNRKMAIETISMVNG